MNSRQPLKPSAALVSLEELCARSEQCTHEVRTRLYRWGIAPDLADKIIQRLKAGKFIDDSRYALAFARDKVVYNRWGKIKVRQALKMKHIDSELIDEALDSIDETEYQDALIEVIKAKGKVLKQPFDFSKKQKILRYAASRGFEPSMIIEIIKQPDLWE